MASNSYIPALRFNWLTRFYDLLLSLTLREKRFKTALIQLSSLNATKQVLDIACGTTTLTLLIKQTFPDSAIIGIDGDITILEMALAKIEKANLDIKLNLGLSYNLPYADASFDEVFCSLFFHHLTSTDKTRTLNEIYRVLKPNGKLYVADWGKALNLFMRFMFYGVQILDGFNTTRDNIEGLLPEFFIQANFLSIKEEQSFNTLFGTLWLYSASKTM